MGIFSWVFWGLFVGAMARLLLPGRQSIGIVWTILLGVAGSVVGGFIATEVIDIADADEFDFGSFLIAVGASVLIFSIASPILARREKKEEAAAD
jgi:uncharacterized membrane protein YeaQ/YmgE (transglycosylase-associated protein family)